MKKTWERITRKQQEDAASTLTLEFEMPADELDAKRLYGDDTAFMGINRSVAKPIAFSTTPRVLTVETIEEACTKMMNYGIPTLKQPNTTMMIAMMLADDDKEEE